MDNSEFAELVSLCDRLPTLVNFIEQQAAYARVQEYVRRLGNITAVMQLASASPTCLFVITEILTKTIVRNECDPEREQQSLVIDQEDDPDLAYYQQIIAGVLPFIFEGRLPQFTVNCCVNLVSICLKYCLTSLHRLGMLEQFMMGCFPQYEFDVRFLNTLDAQVVLVQPSNNYVPPFLTNRLAILISLIEHVEMQTSYRSYFDYRRNMYTFKNNYMAMLLHVAVWYVKVLAEYAVQLPQSTNPELLGCLRMSLKLFEELMCYPYTLHLQEYECDEDIRESSVGQVYFVGYVRNLTEDSGVLQVILRLYRWYNSCTDFQQFQTEILSLIKATGRLASANSYFFDNEIERIRFRQNAADLIATFLQNYRSFDEVYTCQLLQLPFRVLHSYAIKDYDRSLSRLLSSSMGVCQKAVGGCLIKLESREYNAPTKALDILNSVYDECKTEAARQLIGFTTTEIRIALLEVLQGYISRLLTESEAKRILGFQFKNYEKEVDTFEELYKPAVTLFKLDGLMNHKRAGQLDLKSLCPESLTLWTHFYASVLADTIDDDFDYDIAQNTLQLLNFLQFREGVSILRLLSVVVQKVLSKVSTDGRVLSNFWIQLQNLTNGQLSPFLESIVQRCTTRIGQTTENVEYSLQVLSQLYTLLKKNKVANLSTYTEVLKNILNDLEQGIFTTVEFYKRRTKLYEIISSLWLDTYNLQNIYSVYSHVRKSIMTNLDAPTNFLKYLYDMTGLVGQIQSHHTYRVLMELFIRDMKLLEVPYLRSKANDFMQDNKAKKAFIRFAFAVVTDSSKRLTFDTHSPIGMELESLLRHPVEECVKLGVSKHLILLLRNFMRLCPIRPAIAIPFYKQQEVSSMALELNDLLASYFENIHRVQDLNGMYPYIRDSPDWLISWYEEAMTRGLDLKVRASSLQASIESRLWKNSRERENVARLLLALGTYQPALMTYPLMFEGSLDESAFVRSFNEHFK